MAQVQLTVSMDVDLKRLFDLRCAEYGMSANAAFNDLAEGWAKRIYIPLYIGKETDLTDYNLFHRLRADADRGETPELTMEEIVDEIYKCRAERTAEGQKHS